MLGKGFRERCKHTELALNFIQKQYFNPKISFSFHYSQLATVSQQKVVFKIFIF